MRIVLNGEPQRFEGVSTVASLVARLDCGTKGVAVAVNEALVPRSMWAQHALRDDDRVEVLKAAQGG